MEIEELYAFFRKSEGVNTDTRTLQAGQMFIALKGENFDGNVYALQALDAGARYAVVNADSEAARSGREGVLVVEDTLQALTELGKYHRNHVLGEGRHLPVIGLTGTNGKTTTKELICRVLSAKYRVTATQGNLNNDIGVPLSLLRITEDTELAVIEMGANHPDDIARLVEVSQPDYGLITNVGKAHLLGFGSLEGVCQAKGKLYDYLIRHQGTIFLNQDEPILRKMLADRLAGMSEEVETVPYGVDFWHAECLPVDSASPFLRIILPLSAVFGNDTEEELLVETHLAGSYNAQNIMAALAVGLHFGVPVEEAVQAVAAYIPANNRSQVVRTASNSLIVDAYNANPTSMNAALDNFERMEDQHKVLLLGNMGELGKESLSEHVSLLQRILSMRLDRIALVGEEFRTALDQTGQTDSVSWFASSRELALDLKEHPVSDSLVLIKGSRSTAMEKVLEFL